MDDGAQLVFGTAGAQLYLGDGGNGGQCLATETEGVQGEEVGGVFDLRGGMALE